MGVCLEGISWNWGRRVGAVVQRAFLDPWPLVDQTVSECDRALGGLLTALAAGRHRRGAAPSQPRVGGHLVLAFPA